MNGPNYCEVCGDDLREGLCRCQALARAAGPMDLAAYKDALNCLWLKYSADGKHLPGEPKPALVAIVTMYAKACTLLAAIGYTATEATALWMAATTSKAFFELQEVVQGLKKGTN